MSGPSRDVPQQSGVPHGRTDSPELFIQVLDFVTSLLLVWLNNGVGAGRCSLEQLLLTRHARGLWTLLNGKQ
eukprot:1051270-Amphidinium_carterae.1